MGGKIISYNTAKKINKGLSPLLFFAAALAALFFLVFLFSPRHEAKDIKKKERHHPSGVGQSYQKKNKKNKNSENFVLLRVFMESRVLIIYIRFTITRKDW